LLLGVQAEAEAELGGVVLDVAGIVDVELAAGELMNGRS
jgi:hypothetical protein